jgi:arylsulfatase A-like enzyme
MSLYRRFAKPGFNTLALAGSVIIAPAMGMAQQTKPNIIVILVDDMGYSDLGCYGGEIETPNLDMLADNGIKFRQFYNSARCCPTRASLLTGVHPHQAGVGHMTGGHDISESYQGYLNNSVVTIAEVLKMNGYFTIHSGKWHLGNAASMKPITRGFDRSFQGMGFYFGSDMKDQILQLNGVRVHELEDSWYSSLAWPEFGVDCIQEAIFAEQPFFLYLAFNAPHWPLQAPDSVISKYLGRYTEGWSDLRQKRLAKQKEIGLIAQNTVISPDDDRIVSWQSLSEDQKLYQDSIMATYAACVDMLDQGVGVLIDSLKAMGVFDNTLIMFLSDNGACAEGPDSGLGNNSGSGRVGSDVSFVRCGQGWANAQSTPYREYKHWIHEGGVRTPFIVHWPDGISDTGQFRDEPGHIIDIMATIVDVTGATYPETYKGNPIIPMEGVSLVPVFKGEPLNRDTLYWEHEANRGIRVKNMKLVARTDILRVFTDDERDKWELYDMDEDPTELNNLADEYPEMVSGMRSAWETWAIQKGVLPWPWGFYFEREDTEGELFFYYSFDGHFLDITGNTRAIPKNNPPFFQGKYGQGLALNGYNQWVEVFSDVYNHLNVANNDFTLCSWIYNYPGGEDIQNIMSQTDMGGTGRIFLDRMGNNRQHRLSSFVGGSRNISTGTGISQNQWHHVAIVGNKDSKTLTFFLDGQQNGNVIQTGDFESNSGNFRIGVQKTGTRDYWFGIIDEVYLFNRALSIDELQKVMDNDWFGTTHVSEEAIPEITIYPNPVNHVLSVSDNVVVTRMQVMDITGKVLVAVDESNQMNVEGLKNGSYVLKIWCKQGNVYHKYILITL